MPTTVTHTANPAASSFANSGSSLVNSFKGGNGLMLLLALAGFLALSWFGSGTGKKGQLATARFAGGGEKAAARRKALQQIKARKHNVVAFKIYN